ncbi:MAG: UDP-N-acetylmuramoyl-L-alanine--D-glutamate ligase [Methylococcaceae bacterium]|nr:UDP-N-acetylmuramoyl-L-alanine--D-glutamate ligase [Methylococcaceae bacterium]
MRLADDEILGRLEKSFGLTPENSNILVVGLGTTGLSIARFLVRYHFKFKLVDSRNQPPMTAELFKEVPDVTLMSGNFDKVDFSKATHLIVSPGVALTEPTIKNVCKKGAVIVSDIDLFALSTDSPIIAITGSNGKSTVTTMLGEMGNAAGKKTAIGGNLGTAALDLLDGKADLYALELSSFQLERTSALNAAAATVLNISADHLDRHGTLASYAAEKQKIFNGNGVMVLNADDAVVVKMQTQARKPLWFSISESVGFHIAEKEGREYLAYEQDYLMPSSDVPLEGKHNLANALVALALGYAVGLELDKMCQSLKTFKGLEHRMQKVAQINGINWVNDSKATNIGACIAALAGYDEKVILLAGGDAKGADMSELRATITAKTKSVILMGKDAGLIENALGDCVPLYHADSMDNAVLCASKLVESGDTVLLSPACASLDQYKNYQQRGECFAAAVMALDVI